MIETSFKMPHNQEIKLFDTGGELISGTIWHDVIIKIFILKHKELQSVSSDGKFTE